MAEQEGRQPLTREQVEALVEWTKGWPDLFQGKSPYKTAAIEAVVKGTALRYFRQGLEMAAGLGGLQMDFEGREIDLTNVVRTATLQPLAERTDVVDKLIDESGLPEHAEYDFRRACLDVLPETLEKILEMEK